MSTAQQLILAAYQMLGYYGANETMNAADSALGLQQLNMLLDAWSNESLMCYALTEQSFPVVAGKSRYSIGKTGSPDVNATRPIRIMEGPGVAYLQDSNANNYAVDVVPQSKWNQIANRGVNTTSNIPDTLFYDPQMPLGFINLWPTPSLGGYTLYFDSYLQFVDAANLISSFTLPPGYELAIESNLAMLLGPFLKNVIVSQDVKSIARYAKATLKRSNKRNNQSNFDRELLSNAQPTWDVYSGRYNT
jgi:hypothetical protein